ncbi:MAG: hypothetical protein LBC79_02170 [Deltaproteobacteria bacterium]|nr:hypothetical protein [Deltaproteobacteria bacterium]
MPSARIADAVFGAVSELPDSFMDFAVAELKDYATLPSNLGRELFRVLWPRYREKNPQIKARAGNQGCDFCRNAGRNGGGIGWLYAHEPSSGHTILRKCKCIGGGMPQAAWDAGYELGLPPPRIVQ